MRTSRVLGLVIAALFASLILVACGDDDDPGASDEEEADITEVIEFSAASGDPAACTEAQTQAFTEQTTGAQGADAVQQCEEEAAESAQDVEVSNIEVDGETATAEVAITGSFFDGQTLEVGLIREGGEGEGGLLGPETARWKVDELIGFVDEFDREAFSAAFRESIAQEEGVPSGAVECVTENVDVLSEQQIEDLFVNSDRELENQVFEPCFGEQSRRVSKPPGSEQAPLSSALPQQLGLLPMQFEFQREEDGEYRSFGTAEGSGDQAVDAALDLLMQGRGGSLPSGAYRVRPKDDPNADWLPFTLPTDGPISPR